MQDYITEYKHVCEAFFEGRRISDIVPWGEGHINRTMLIYTGGNKYILQRINTSVFHSPDDVMNNINYVTKHLISKGHETLEVIPTLDNNLYLRHDTGCYRIYKFINKTITYQTAPDIETLYLAGEAYGEFQNALADFDASLLKETIVNFHNTPNRYKNFKASVDANSVGRLDSCIDEVNFVTDRGNTYSKIHNGLADGSIPVRTTHNDTKLNNILMDKDTGKARAIVDLDTVMPGSMLYDFGDAIRFSASTGAEDEKDLSKIHFDINLFAAYTRGYLKALGEKVTERELELMPYSAYLMTMECGMRFLTDYLSGDVYFNTHYPEHNLIRCRTQFKLASEMEKQFDKMSMICKDAI